MALQSRIEESRPSLATSNQNSASQLSLSLSTSPTATRKANRTVLAGGPLGPSYSQSPSSKMLGQDGREIAIGDIVDVPGAMHGVVKFIGQVEGKKGIFAGVELSREYAPRGKNDGDVQGVQYFKTTIPGSGIFLPVNRASRRSSDNSSDNPLTPTTPAWSNGTAGTQHKPVALLAQSLGPGARPPSPSFKPKSRQSLPRPGSPLRKGLVLPPPPPPPANSASLYSQTSLSKSQIGTPRFTASTTARPNFRSKTPQPSRSYSRANSRVSNGTSESHAIPSGYTTPVPASANGSPQDELIKLRKQLVERDKQLRDQAASLAEMENSLQDLSKVMPERATVKRRGSAIEDTDAAQLRILIRDKNDKMAQLIAEFDAHRADFRSTIDTLELASTETERVYEKRVEELLAEIRELHVRTEDVDTVARQLKQLEELVQELEEGLEDSRRGEAEARGEVEFLRGEVERTRTELRREREKTAASMKTADAIAKAKQDPREVEQRDDEIRGLKAIIHSLSSGPELADSRLRRTTTSGSDVNESSRLQHSLERLEREKKELQILVERRAMREAELERELEKVSRASRTSDNYFDQITTQDKQDKHDTTLDSKGTIRDWKDSFREVRPATAVKEGEPGSSKVGNAALWCQICERSGHDFLTCSTIRAAPKQANEPVRDKTTETRNGMILTPGSNNASTPNQDPDRSRPLLSNGSVTAQPSLAPTSSVGSKDHLPKLGATSVPAAPQPGQPPASSSTSSKAGQPIVPASSTLNMNLIAGADGTKDVSKWCAICEHDGHDSINCALCDEY